MKKHFLVGIFAISFAASAQAEPAAVNNQYGLGAMGDVAETQTHSRNYILLKGNRGGVIDSKTDNNISGGRTVEFGDDWGAAAALGYQVGDYLRAEAEFGYSKNHIKDNLANNVQDNLTAYSAMGNLIFDIMGRNVYSPFIGAGVGAVRLEDANDSDTALAYQALGGIRMQVLENLDVVLDYKYLQAQDAEFDYGAGGKTKVPYKNTSVEAGIKYGF